MIKGRGIIKQLRLIASVESKFLPRRSKVLVHDIVDQEPRIRPIKAADFRGSISVNLVWRIRRIRVSLSVFVYKENSFPCRSAHSNLTTAGAQRLTGFGLAWPPKMAAWSCKDVAPKEESG